MKYQAQVEPIKPLLASATNILIAMPKDLSVDALAAGLALYLSLQQASKQVAVATEGVIKVGHSNIFGIGEIKNKLPQAEGGNFTVTLGNVVATDGTVPALQKLDWMPGGPDKKDLKLVFQVIPGQKLEPTFVNHSYEGGGYDLIFVVGSLNLNSLGLIYTSNTQVFASAQVINIDNSSANTQFGAFNITDPVAASLSEMLGQILPDLQLSYNQDIASNILSGIYESTNNLQSEKVNADTFEAISQALRVGGQKPNLNAPVITPVEIPLTPQPAQVGIQSQELPAFNEPVIQPTPGFDLSKIFNPPAGTIETSSAQPPAPQEMPSAEETPNGEAALTESPEADWLTPKIYKGKGGIG